MGGASTSEKEVDAPQSGDFTRYAAHNLMPRNATWPMLAPLGVYRLRQVRINWQLCRGLRSSKKILEIAGCGGWQGRTARKIFKAIREAVAIWLWSIAACARRERLVTRAVGRTGILVTGADACLINEELCVLGLRCSGESVYTLCRASGLSGAGRD